MNAKWHERKSRRDLFNAALREMYGHEPGKEFWLGVHTNFYSDEEISRKIKDVTGLLNIRRLRDLRASR